MHHLRPFALLGLIVLLVGMARLTGQERITEFGYYPEPMDYAAEVPGEVPLVLVAKTVSPEVIDLRRLEDPTGRKPDNKWARYPWAITYGGRSYFNLRYTREYLNMEVFSAGTVVGSFAVIDVTPESDPIIRNGGANTGGGLGGALMKGADKWGKGWEDERGVYHRVLVHRLYAPDGSPLRPQDRSWVLLDRRNVGDTIGRDLNGTEVGALSYEQLMDTLRATAPKNPD